MKKLNYSKSVNYDLLDPVKRLSQKKGAESSKNLLPLGMKELPPSRGETAYIWDAGSHYLAFTLECLGTKNLIAQDLRKITGKTYYREIAQDTVAAIVNDIVAVGAKPMVINAYFAVGNSDWFSDKERSKDLVEGWAKACELAGATWGGGESPSLTDVVEDGAIDLAGACVGIIKPKRRLTLGDKLTEEDRIVLIESSGIHANGASMTRTIAKQLKKGYAEILPDGKLYGEAILRPTYIYAKLVDQLFKEKVDIHYMVNITGHGWRKIMRLNKEFTYRMTFTPSYPALFDFIKEKSGNSIGEMYGTFNMGAGFAVFVPKKDLSKVLEVSRRNKFKAWDAGIVERGEKQVIIEPKNIVFKGATLDLR